jgi:hypothetical protein
MLIGNGSGGGKWEALQQRRGSGDAETSAGVKRAGDEEATALKRRRHGVGDGWQHEDGDTEERTQRQQVEVETNRGTSSRLERLQKSHHTYFTCGHCLAFLIDAANLNLA